MEPAEARPVGIAPTAPIVRGTVSVGIWAMNDETPPNGGAAGAGCRCEFLPLPGDVTQEHVLEVSPAYASGSSSHNRGPTCRRTHISRPRRPGGRRQGSPGSRVPGMAPEARAPLRAS